jgi:uncharacterized membrane protein YdfJ with MMPL/SSD domain
MILGKSTKQAVIIMLSSAGSTVFISGLTLCGSFAGKLINNVLFLSTCTILIV